MKRFLILSIERKNVVVFKLGSIKNLPSKYWVVNYFKLSKIAKRETTKELTVDPFWGDIIIGWYKQYVKWYMKSPRCLKRLFKGKYFILVGLTIELNDNGDVLIGRHPLSKLVHDEIESNLTHETVLTEEAQGYKIPRKIK